ncbi:MAG: peroxiredoxin family protein [Candidatus Geothermincolia bacterium]
MGDIRKRFAEFQSGGVGIISILAQSEDEVAAWLARREQPFEILVDPERRVVREYGVYVGLNFESRNISRPAVFIIDAAGVIRFEYIGYHQRDYPEVEHILEALSEFTRSPKG